MRPNLSWSDLGGRSVGLWGLGVEGRASLARLQAMGVEPVLVDDRPAGPLEGRPVLATDDGGLSQLAGCEVVVKAPGISRHRADVTQLTDRGVAVVGGLGLWLQGADRSRVVAITGTKGKSTTAAVTGHLLRNLGYRCLVAGNIGRPPFDPSVGDDYDYWVVEVSSFQATDVASSPPVVAVTSLFPDHLDWHGDVGTYYAEKLSLCAQPGARLTIADGSSDALRARLPAPGVETRWVQEADPGLDGAWVDRLGLAGPHNRRNALIARACLQGLGVDPSEPSRLERAAEGFEPLASRLQHIGTIEGVDFVDDSLSTNVLSATAALDALAGRRVALIVGGFDRGIDYAPLAAALAGRSGSTLVLTLPDNGPRIHAALTAHGPPGPTVVDFPSLEEATARAFEWARPDGVVLLSPAAPSFGTFTDYRHRAAAFEQAMRRCAGGG